MADSPLLIQSPRADDAATARPAQNLKKPAQGLPLVWLLVGSKTGESAQQRLLARALGWRVVEQPTALSDFSPSPGEAWPDLVISFGKGLRAARRVQAQSDRRTRLVHLGRPRWTRLDAIDLIIPMPQDRLPPAPNLLSIRMAFNDRDPAESQAAAQRLRDAPWHALPRPRTLLLVGGSTRHFRFDEGDTARLANLASAHAARRGGSLLVTTSPRTTPSALTALLGRLTAPHTLYQFRPDDADNPLAAWLHEADDLIVTGDTASMLAEARRSLRPVYVLPLARRSGLRHGLLAVLRAATPRLIYEALLRRGLIAAPVDLSGWLTERIADGDFAVLGESAQPFEPQLLIDDDLQRAVTRIHALF